MPSSSTDEVPATPRVISPSPVPSSASSSRDDYTGPRTRSAARRQRLVDVSEERSEDVDTDPSRSPTRSRSRSPAAPARSTRTRRSNPMIPARKPEPLKTNGRISPTDFLSPNSALGKGRAHDISRSPSPLGLIPLHTRYRSFIHRHEIPRKLLHGSIGFFTLYLYSRGVQTLQITPWLLSALVPIAATDIIRHRSETFNKLYIRCVGALMRETEVSGYNGVIWYLLGAYSVLRFFPKDVAVMGVLLLSWCDTAASTFGRLYGRRTFQLRAGKSFAGTLAAWVVGVVTAAAFWGWFVPYVGTFPNDPEGSFMFTGRLNLLPDSIRGLLGWTADSDSSCGVISGPLALGVMSVVSGIIAAGSEFVDLFNWDDNFTIPVLSGIGLWGFLKVFG
ncbi:hypothetical protein Asppvi_006844 [Aspergillus pseudoviridinutans]|uniref:Phosphatidate cytidylyltransferase n=1 Tax=Aspergillus pseudoviridinutans TaxID=1517512 RepID=A0A9P3BAU9_9EURO|nr:uncharacterized protein Asppvi_006844 [Aspergillus pseudoviridinutans]GIJ87931.1 hypothetical protein Asppvi_006844 [Aspergillus pseudoviridinutans]